MTSGIIWKERRELSNNPNNLEKKRDEVAGDDGQFTARRGWQSGQNFRYTPASRRTRRISSLVFPSFC